jgi:hypothetical protein
LAILSGGMEGELDTRKYKWTQNSSFGNISFIRGSTGVYKVLEIESNKKSAGV